MPRPQPPLTPADSTDIAARDKQTQGLDMEGTFLLPPAAVSPVNTKSTAKGPKSSNQTRPQPSSPPPSPEDRSTTSKSSRKRTLSSASKTPAHSTIMSAASPAQAHDLPPPPSRARKIIQMKPKQSPNLTAQDQATSVSSSTSKNSSQAGSTTTKRTKTQPGPTTAAGRKIARKTAHSIIERRRRSKMNEEFGVLKDMIPACDGVEMHKLAILQAGIEYVRYLEGCIEKLKDRNEELEATLGRTTAADQEDDMEVDADTEHEAQTISRPASTAVTEDSFTSDHNVPSRPQHGLSHSLHSKASASQVTSAASSTYASPSLRPTNSSTSTYHQFDRQSQPQSHYSILPPISTHAKTHHAPSISVHGSVPNSPLLMQAPVSATTSRGPPSINNTPTATPFGTLATGISPAIHAFQFSPDFNRAATYASSTPGTSASLSSVSGHASTDGKHSPHIAPLPQAALPLPAASFRAPNGNLGDKPGAAEANATAALLMMGSDRRTSLGLPSKGPSDNSGSSVKSGSGKGMSVKDLLSS